MAPARFFVLLCVCVVFLCFGVQVPKLNCESRRIVGAEGVGRRRRS